MLLVGVDFKLLAAPGGQIGHGLVGQVHPDLRLVVGLDALEKFFKKVFGHHHWQHEIVEFVVLVDVGKERTYHHAEARAGDGPCGMFAGRSRTEVLAGHEYHARIARVVHHKVFLGRAVGVVPPVAEEVVAHALLVGGFKKACGDNLVGIYVLQRQRNAAGGDDVKFLFHWVEVFD